MDRPDRDAMPPWLALSLIREPSRRREHPASTGNQYAPRFAHSFDNLSGGARSALAQLQRKKRPQRQPRKGAAPKSPGTQRENLRL